MQKTCEECRIDFKTSHSQQRFCSKKCSSSKLVGTQSSWLSQRTHGMCSTPTYKIWTGIIHRCTNPKSDPYNKYVNRGIRICDRWRVSFENFLADMGPRPPGMSIDRIDGDGNYEPGNCRWATPTQQARNTRGVRLSGLAVVLLRQLKVRGTRSTDLAHAFGVSIATVNKALSGDNWKAPLDDIGVVQ